MKLYGSERHKTPRRRGRTVLILCLALIALILAAAAAGAVYVGGIDTIYPNVTLNGIELGGLTEEVAAQTLADRGVGAVEPVTVTVRFPSEHVLKIHSEEVCTPVSTQALAGQVFTACKGTSLVEGALNYVKSMTGGIALEEDLRPVPDRQAVLAAVEAAAAEVCSALSNAGVTIGEEELRLVKSAQNVSIDSGALTDRIVEALGRGEDTQLDCEPLVAETQDYDFHALLDSIYTTVEDAAFDEEGEIVPETVGISFDPALAAQLWSAADYGDEIIIPLTVEEPEVTAEELEELRFRDKLSEITTSLSGSSWGRLTNVRLAAESVNGVVLMPGEEFDYNTTLGKRTKENGYQLAGAYSDGQTVQEYGGGICQVSSMVYYCSLYANLKITDRTCHMFPVAYMLPGLDATVSWGGPEFRFVNDREYPIRIVASVAEDNRTVTVEFWGTDVDGSYVEMTYSTEPVYDKEYPEVVIGYKAETYRSVFDSEGKRIKRVREAGSRYSYHDEDIDWPQEVLDERARQEAEERGEPWPPVTEEPEVTQPPEESPQPEEPTPSEEPVETEEPTPSETPAPSDDPAQPGDDPGAPGTEETPAPEPTPEVTEPVGE